jgi:class 3 adenylate cyclase
MYETMAADTIRPPCGNVTVCFTVSGGFKYLADRKDSALEEAVAAATDLLDETIAATIQSNHGYLCKGQQSKFMAVFPSPRAGLDFSMAVHEALAAAAWPAALLEADLHTPLGDIQGPRLSIGLSSGEPAMFSFNKKTQIMDYFGPLVNMAARVCGQAAPGQTLVHTSVNDAAAGFDSQTVGLRKLKGIKDETELFCVVNAKLQPRRAQYQKMSEAYAALAGTEAGSGLMSPGSAGAMSPGTDE